MKLMTREIECILPPLYHFETTQTPPIATVKFFDPTGSWSWYVAEGKKQDDGDWLFWGAVDGIEFEVGYFTLFELQHAKDGCKGLQALPIERDLHFTPAPLKELSARR
jgi:hypothetical protein